MALLVSLHQVSKSFGSQILFKQLSFALNEADRMGLAGPNGAGKSTLLKVIAGQELPEEGHVARRQGMRLSFAGQFPHFPEGKTLEEILMAEVPFLSPEEAQIKANILLDKAGFKEVDQTPLALSGGWKKRLDIIRCFMSDPDLVLLDEPTNHLDLEGIDWLQQFLRKEKAACLIVSHDRYFLENVCTKIAEINRCYPEGVFISDGNWSKFVERKELFLLGQQERQRSLAGTVKEEVEWLRRSPKARTCKSKSRVQKAHDLIEELDLVRQRNTQVKADLQFVASERETRNLLVATNLSKTMGDRLLFKSVNLKLSPGTRLGIVGKNGTGKTTLLKILAGSLTQDLGTVKYAQDVKLVYFDQHRETLDPSLTLKEALSPLGDFVRFHGQDIHVNGWAKKFLFPPERLNLKVECLSGGEKARILMARLMLKPADVLFLDEPTNDLDIPTLEVIEESLQEFPGAVVLITHDRYLMNQICNQILSLGEGAEPKTYADYVQWQSSEEHKVKEERPKQKESAPKPISLKKKLSYKEQKELEGMEEALMKMEHELALLNVQSQNPNLQSHEIYEKMAFLQKNLDSYYERWQYLLDLSQ